MAQLTNTRYELFALGLSRGLSQNEAYRQAGFSINGTANSSSLAKRPEVRARVEELIAAREEAAGRGDIPDEAHEAAVNETLDTGVIDRKWVIVSLMDIVKLAKDAAQFAAANKALELLGKEAGMFQEMPAGKKKEEEELKKIEESNRIARVPIEQLTHAIDTVLKGGEIKPKGPGRGYPVDPLSAAKRDARMKALPRYQDGRAIPAEEWTPEQRERLQQAVEEAERVYRDAHPDA